MSESPIADDFEMLTMSVVGRMEREEAAPGAAAAGPTADQSDVAASIPEAQGDLGTEGKHNQEPETPTTPIGEAHATSEETKAGSSGSEEKESGEEEEEELDILGTGAITKKVLRSGQENTRPDRGQEVRVVASCIVDGVAEFEDKAFTLRVGEGDVSMAWDIILPLMEVGEIAECKSSYRFDKRANATPESSISYRMELVSVHDTTLPEDMSVDERLLHAATKRTRGNEYFRDNDLDSAASSFKRAIELVKLREGEDASPRKKELFDAIIPCWNNLALVQMRAESFALAFESLENVLKIDPQNEKAIYRKAKCQIVRNNIDDAIAELDKIVPKTQDENVRTLFKEAQILKKAQNEKDKVLYKRMVSALDGSSPDVLKRDREIEEERKAKEAAKQAADAAAEQTRSEEEKQTQSEKLKQIVMAVVFGIVSVLAFYAVSDWLA